MGQGTEDGDNVGRPRGRKQCPYRSTKRLSLIGFLGRAQSLTRPKKELTPILMALKTQFIECVF
jgi:hypothetical protein